VCRLRLRNGFAHTPMSRKDARTRVHSPFALRILLHRRSGELKSPGWVNLSFSRRAVRRRKLAGRAETRRYAGYLAITERIPFRPGARFSKRDTDRRVRTLEDENSVVSRTLSISLPLSEARRGVSSKDPSLECHVDTLSPSSLPSSMPIDRYSAEIRDHFASLAVNHSLLTLSLNFFRVQNCTTVKHVDSPNRGFSEIYRQAENASSFAHALFPTVAVYTPSTNRIFFGVTITFHESTLRHFGATMRIFLSVPFAKIRPGRSKRTRFFSAAASS